MLGFILFIRTLVIGAILITSALFAGVYITHALRYYKIINSYSAEGVVMLIILGLFWFLYRRFFQQYLYINDDES